MKKLLTIIGLFVVACLLQACDSGQDVPGVNIPPVKCTDGKIDYPVDCVDPNTTESPPDDDVWVEEDTEPPIGCSNLEHIAGKWWDKDYGNEVMIYTTSLTTTCEVTTEGTSLNDSIK